MSRPRVRPERISRKGKIKSRFQVQADRDKKQAAEAQAKLELEQQVLSLETMLKKLGPQGEMIVQKCVNLPLISRKTKMLAMFQVMKAAIEEQVRFKEQPVDIETFVTSKEYLGMPLKPHITEDGEIYLVVMEELKKICSKDYLEVVLTGGIGSSKTTVALILLAYHLYLVSCLRDPHKEYGLIKSDEIVFIFQSLNATHAKTVDYGRFKAMINNSPYFHKHFMFNKQIDSELQFPNRVVVKPVSGSSTAAIGQNVISGILDEINFMKVTEKSKQSRDAGSYDQAWENYNAIVRRRESRFLKMGRMPGILCLVSSKRYPGEFTDIKIQEAKTNDKIYIYDKRVWEIAPAGKFLGEFFKVFKGDNARKPRVLLDDEVLTKEDQLLVMDIPVEYRNSFKTDILGSMRDIAGVSMLALEPFLIDIETVKRNFGGVDSVLSADVCDFKDTHISFFPKKFKRLDQPRFVHIDLGITGDSAGVGCGYVSGFTQVERDEGFYETLPNICFDFILEVAPPKNEEIQFHKIRLLLYKLKEAGLPIKWVSLDLFQSVDTVQLLHRRGFVTGIQSMDRTNVPYDITKSALMDERILAPEHDKAYMELISLERDVKKNKIDHGNVHGKDLADTIAGVTFGLTMRREIWVKYGISLVHIPQHLISKANKAVNSIDGRNAQEVE